MTFVHFKMSEFACRHCGKNLMDGGFVHQLDALRDLCRFPLVVTSGYRCAAHNVAVSTTGPNGPHTTGRAVDLSVSRSKAFWLLHWAGVLNERARSVGKPLVFTGIGTKQAGPSRFIHLDNLTEPGHLPRPTVWDYGG